MPSDSNDADLLSVIKEMIENSPALSNDAAQKEQLMSLLPTLSEEQLVELKELLNTEETDWRQLAQEFEAFQGDVMEQVQEESREIEKEVDTALKEGQKAVSKAEQQEAEELLKHFDD